MAKLKQQSRYSCLDMYHWSDDQNSNIRKVEGTTFNQEYVLYDLSLHAKGPQEDEVLANDQVLYQNIRRGNTILIRFVLGTRGKDKSRIVDYKRRLYWIEHIEWARKGLYKFFDMSLEFTQQSATQNLEEQGSFDGNFSIQYKSNDSKGRFRELIFRDVEQVLLQGGTVDIYKTNKANGENAQISYNSALGAWMIASKNVCLAARNSKDLRFYSLTRYQYATLIAEQWFHILNSLPQDQVQVIQEQLTGYTIIGEYVGNPEYQHLVRYFKQTILFYAMVENAGEKNCVPPLQAYSFFKQSGLDCVKVEVFKGFSNLRDFYNKCESLFIQVAEERIEEGEEGSVLYFIHNEQPSNQDIITLENHLFNNVPINQDISTLIPAAGAQNVISLCKLKTLEYRIFRKLREKLKNLRGNPKQKYAQFVGEVKQLTDGFKVPRAMEFYLTAAKAAIEFVSLNPGTLKSLSGRYIDFLEKVFQKIGPERALTPSAPANTQKAIVLVTLPALISEAEAISLAHAFNLPADLRYGWPSRVEEAVYICNKIPDVNSDIFQSAIVVFSGFTQEGKDQALQNLKSGNYQLEANEDLKQFTDNNDQETLLDEFMHNIFAVIARVGSRCVMCESFASFDIMETLQGISAPQPIPQPKSKPSTNKQRKIYIIVPMGIPGMGKSHLVPSLEPLLKAHDITIAVVSSDKTRAQCMDEYASKTGTKNRDILFDKTKDLGRDRFFEEVGHALLVGGEKHIVFLDKNHPPNAIQGTFDNLRQKCPQNAQLEFIALIPRCKQTLNLNIGRQRVSYPLSLEFLLECILRVRDRKSHETLVGPFNKKLDVTMMMFSFYKNVRFEQYKSEGFSEIISIPFTSERTISDQNIIDALYSALGEYQPMRGGQKFQQLVKLLQRYPNAQVDVQNTEEFQQALIKIIGERPQTQEQRPQSTPAQQPAPKTNLQNALYLGIDCDEPLQPYLTFLLSNALRSFQKQYQDPEMQQDISTLLPTLSQYTPSLQINPHWRYAKSLHLTTIFLQNNRRNLNHAVAKAFEDGKPVELELTSIAYVPRKLICASAEILTPGISSVNPRPHITMMVGEWAAKHSNDVLQAVHELPEIARHVVKILQTNVQIYTTPLMPRIRVLGVYKAFNQ